MDSRGWYKFQPDEDKLVSLLKKRRIDPSFTDPVIKEINLYKYHPSELPELSSVQTDEPVWYFLTTLEKKYGKGEPVNRTTKGGFWQITGSDRAIKAKHSGQKIGTRKILVFFEGCHNNKKKTDWVMHEIHESHSSKDPKDKLVICRIERKRKEKRHLSGIRRKQEKKRRLSSARDGGELSHNLVYVPQNNVTEDILEVEPQPLQDHHLSSGFNNDFANNSLLEVGSQPLPNSFIDVTKNNFQEQLESQLLPNQHISSNGDLVVKNISSELDSQLLPNQDTFPNIGDHAAKTIYSELESDQLLPNCHSSCTIEDYVEKKNFPENESQPLTNQHLSSTIENHAGKGILSEVELQPLQDHQLPSGFNNYVMNDGILEVGSQLLPKSYVLELESQLLPNCYLSCTTENRVANNSTTEDQITNNSFSENESQLLPNQHLPSDVENDAGKGILSEVQPQVPVEGDELSHFSRMDHNSISTLQSLIHPTPEFSYSNNLSNDLTPWLEHKSLSAVQSTIYPPPGSSYSTSFTNNLTDWQLHHNSLSALHFPIHSPPESSYSSNLSNDSNNWIERNSFSSLPSLIRPQPRSSYSPDFRNDSNVWAFAAEREDDISSPETAHASPLAPYLNSSEAVAGGYVGNGTGSISAWPNEQFPMTNGDYRFNNTFVNQGYVQY